MVCSCTASWYPVSRSPEGTVTWATCARAVPVPDVARPERQLEPLAVLGPHLRHPERARHVIVLHPGQVPDTARRSSSRRGRAGRPAGWRSGPAPPRARSPGPGRRRRPELPHSSSLSLQSKAEFIRTGRVTRRGYLVSRPAWSPLTVVRGTVPTCPQLAAGCDSRPPNPSLPVPVASWTLPRLTVPCGHRAARRRRHRHRRRGAAGPGHDGRGGAAGHRDRRAPGRAGGHRHREVAGLPGPGDPARGEPRAARSWWPRPRSRCSASWSTATCRAWSRR